jgi:RNA polymerase sigma-70 factor (ECF subfamily)
VAEQLPLSRAFAAALRDRTDVPVPSEELEAALQALWHMGRMAWPRVELGGEEFVADVARRLGRGEAAPRTLSRLHGSDLFLACACARGQPSALTCLEANFLSRIPAYVARLDPLGTLADEVAQELRTALLVAVGEAAPRIRDYSGRGDLASWLRVVALRAALKLRRSQRLLGVGVVVPSVNLGPGPDLERDYLRVRYRKDYEAAFSAALGALESEERLFLKLHYVDGLNIDRIGAIYQLHRSTVARRLASHRRRLLELTRNSLRERLHLSDSEFGSVMALVRSQMAVSLRLSAAEPPGRR